MLAILNDFPISGPNVSSVLRATFYPEQLWIISDIETLAEPPAKLLGDLWKKVQVGIVRLSTSELCDALDCATQIISLDVRLHSDPLIRLVVEDGVVVACSLP